MPPAAGAPIVLAAPNTLPATLKTLHVGRIVILGETTAVSVDVEHAVAGYTTGSVIRTGGADRCATAAASARAEFPHGADTCSWHRDQLPRWSRRSPGGMARASGLLLTAPDAIPAATARALDTLQPSRIVILGDVNAVDSEVAAAATAWGQATRVAGSDRYATAVALLREAVTSPTTTMYVPTGRPFPHASAGAVAGLPAQPHRGSRRHRGPQRVDGHTTSGHARVVGPASDST